MQKPKLNKNFAYIGAAGLLALMASGIAIRYVRNTVAE